MVKLKNENYNGFELEFILTHINNITNVIGFAFIEGSATNKNNYKYKFNSSSKKMTFINLKRLIDKNENIKKLSLNESLNIVNKNYKNIIILNEINYNKYINKYQQLEKLFKLNDLLMYDGEDFKWIKNQLKSKNNINIIKQEEIIINEKSFIKFKIK